MKINEIYTYDGEIIRILFIKESQCLVIDCNNNSMPVWRNSADLSIYSLMREEDFFTLKGFEPLEEDTLAPERRKAMYERYSMIAPILPFVGNENTRSHVINTMAADQNISGQTIRNYLKRYLIFRNKQILLPKERVYKTELTKDQKNMRWSLNKFFYTFEKNSLHTAYVKMLKEKYCDITGTLMDTYPTFNQYRYFYRKTRKLENYYIARNGLTNYQRNDRPCIGDNVRVYASAPGLGMVDATICDIYLVNDTGQVVGRPILTACVDAYSGVCMGYSLGWEGGVYSVRDMALNMIEDKSVHCKRHGIVIDNTDWPVNSLPGRILSDQGSEYTGSTLEQIAELGVILENLPPYRPDLKGSVEKFFDIIQSLYKKNLKGKGVIEPDYRERGAHDYRKDACLTLESFRKIILRCIIHYNSSNVIEEYPFTDEMLTENIRPYPSDIWNYGLKHEGANLISVSREELTLCLLPRTKGNFSRFGLSVNKLHYRNDSFKERYLRGGEAIVAYDPDSTNFVWVIEKGKYIRFDLIESRYVNHTVQDVQNASQRSQLLVNAESHNQLQSEVTLANQIQSIVENTAIASDNNTKNIRRTRKAETLKGHRSHVMEAGLYE